MRDHARRDSGRLRRVGALWKPKPGGKSLGTGEITVNGFKQRFVVLRNDRKENGSRQPDYTLMSGDEPERDDYDRERQRAASHARESEETQDDDIPF
jgi:hypothetical protein